MNRVNVSLSSIARNTLILIAAVAALSLLPAQTRAQPEHAATTPAAHTDAAHESHAGHDPVGVIPTVRQGIVPAIVALVVFSVVFGLLSTMVWPKISAGLKERENKIRDEIDSAEQARKQAKDALDQYQQSLAQARAESQKMLEQTKAQQLALAADLKAKAEVELGQLREKATRDIEQAKRAAIAEIYAQTTTLATAVAAKILRREIRPEDQQQLVEESLRQMASR